MLGSGHWIACHWGHACNKFRSCWLLNVSLFHDMIFDILSRIWQSLIFDRICVFLWNSHDLYTILNIILSFYFYWNNIRFDSEFLQNLQKVILHFNSSWLNDGSSWGNMGIPWCVKMNFYDYLRCHVFIIQYRQFCLFRIVVVSRIVTMLYLSLKYVRTTPTCGHGYLVTLQLCNGLPSLFDPNLAHTLTHISYRYSRLTNAKCFCHVSMTWCPRWIVSRSSFRMDYRGMSLTTSLTTWISSQRFENDFKTSNHSW